MYDFPEVICFNKDTIDSIDLSFYKEFYSEDSYVFDPKAHYRILTYITKQFNNIQIIDAGTHHGASALALSQNKSNRVLSFDSGFYSVPFRGKLDNCVIRQFDVFGLDKKILNETQLIFLDIDPHNGTNEIKFVQMLMRFKYRGILVCDDIHLHTGMETFWKWLPKYKCDITSCGGHFSGTGISCFNPKIIRFIKEQHER